MNHEEEIENLKREVTQLKGQIADLKHQLQFHLEIRKEQYYQKFLEKELGATHKRTVHGITDITTQDEHIEIKHWKNYKHALGQLLSYNHNDTKRVCAYFYGEIDENKKNEVVELFKSNSVSIKQFIQYDTYTKIETVLDPYKKINDTTYNFLNWLNENIKYKEGGLLQLKDICYHYLGKTNIHSNESSKYKKEVEKWIRQKHKTEKWEYDFIWVNKKSMRGWKNFAIKNQK
jgi:hypothetical protein